MSTDIFLQQFKYSVDEQIQSKQKEGFNQVTDYFKKNNPQYISSYYEDQYQSKIAFADKTVMICLEIIIKLNVPVHIINEKFRICLLDYYKWRCKTLSNQTSICIKVDHIIEILVLQIKQFIKYDKADPEHDDWRKEIDADTEKAGYSEGFVALFFGMFIYKNILYTLSARIYIFFVKNQQISDCDIYRI